MCLVIVGVLALSAVAYAMFDENLLKRELTRALGREVTFRNFSPGLLKISLEGVGVGNLSGFAADPLLRSSRLDLKYSLFSILKGKLVIDRVVLTNARISLERRADGSSNYDDLAARSKDGSMLVIREVGFDGVDITARLDSRLIELKSIKGEITNISQIPNLFDLQGQISGAGFHVEGSINPDSQVGGMKVAINSLALDPLNFSTESLDLSGLTAALSGNLGFSSDTFAWDGLIAIPRLAEISGQAAGRWNHPLEAIGAMTITARAENLIRVKPLRSTIAAYRPLGGVRAALMLSGSSAGLSKSISGEFLGLSLSPPGAKKPLEQIKGRFRATPKEAILEQVSFMVGGRPISVSGRIGLEPKTLDLIVSGKSVDVGALAALAPQMVPAGMSLRGNASLDLKIKGSLDLPRVDGWIGLEGMSVGLSDPKTDFENVRGRLELAGDAVKLTGVTAHMKSTMLNISGTYDRKNDRADLKVKADNIVLAELPADLASRTLDVKGAASFDGTITGHAAAPVVKGEIRSHQLDLYGIPMTDVVTNVAFDNPSLDLDHLHASLMGGEISGSAGLNILSAARSFHSNLSGQSLNFANVISLLTRFTGSSFNGLSGGAVSGKFSVSALNFSDPNSFSGSGVAEAVNVDLGGVKVIAALAQALGAGQLKSVGEIANMTAGENFKRYQSIRGSFAFDGGRIRINDTIRLHGLSDQTIGFHGSVGLDGTLNGLIADVELPEKWFNDQTGAVALALLGGRISGNKATLPVSFTGSFSAPRPIFLQPDPKNLLQLFGSAHGGVAGDTIPSPGGFTIPSLPGLGNSTPQEPESAAARPKSRNEEVIDMIGNIFGNR